jgi:transposase-like protein/DNA-directed RNA polymerase subunit RPC12/RpoP
MNNKKTTKNIKQTKTIPKHRSHKPPKYPNVFCDHCGSNYVVKYGKEQKNHLQKYKCKICAKQFILERSTKTKIHKHGHCPLCDSPLQLRKSNPNSNQLRCSNRPNCRFTISYNKKLNQFYYQAVKQQLNFYKLPKFFKFPQEVILFALRLYFLYKLSLRNIQKEIKLKFPNVIPPSHTSILKWANKLSYMLSLALLNKNLSTTGHWLVWATDDTVIKINKHKHFFIAVMDYHTGCILSWSLLPTKDAQAVSFTLNLASKLTNSIPHTIISDHAQNFSLAIKNTFFNLTNHFQTTLYSKNLPYSNNKLERFFGYVKDLFKRKNNFRAPISAYAFFCVFVIYHNLKILKHKLNLNINILIYKHLKVPILRSLLLCLAF